MITGHIYSLQCPDTFEVKYIGGTIYPPERYKCHLRSPKYGNLPLHLWIADLLEKDKKPVMSILYTCDQKDISKYEHKFYDLYISLGCDLFNTKGYREQHHIIDVVKLKNILRANRVTVKSVADNLGFHHTSVSEYLRNKCTINIHKAKILNDYILSLDQKQTA